MTPEKWDLLLLIGGVVFALWVAWQLAGHLL